MYHARAQGVPRWEMCSTHGAVLLVRVTGKEAGLVVRALQEASYFGPAALISQCFIPQVCVQTYQKKTNRLEGTQEVA